MTSTSLTLALTESITRLADGPVPDAVYAEAERRFNPPKMAQLIFAITAIDAWNRLSVAAQKHPPTR